jgi:sucrose-6-phosphate hydrolase SacC (GH32 family)
MKSLSFENSTLEGNSLEIKINFQQADPAAAIGLLLRDEEREYPLTVDRASHELHVLNEKRKLEQYDPTGSLNLHVFIDHSVVEVFVNERESLSTWLRPVLSRDGTWNIRLLCDAGEIEAWQLSL